MIKVDDYLGKKFHWRELNCWELTRNVWKEITGVEIGYPTPDGPLSSAMFTERLGRGLQDALDTGVLTQCEFGSPTLAFFTSRFTNPHCGVVIDGLVLHIMPFHHVRHDPVGLIMEQGKLETVSYYR